MNALKYAFGLILVGGFALTASCGGSSDTTSGGSTGGSSSSTGGTSSTTTGGGLGTGNNTGNGGTFSSGGSGTSTGGSGMTTTGGTGTATGGSGGTRATGGAGGAIMNPAGCPATAPAVTMMGTPGEACTPLAMPGACSYTTATGTERCFCAPSFGGPGGGAAGAGTAGDTWFCTVQQTPMACAPTAATGDMCTASCTLPNNGGTCRCRRGMLQCPMTGAAGAGG